MVESVFVQGAFVHRRTAPAASLRDSAAVARNIVIAEFPIDTMMLYNYHCQTAHTPEAMTRGTEARHHHREVGTRAHFWSKDIARAVKKTASAVRQSSLSLYAFFSKLPTRSRIKFLGLVH
jgi:hypothetical protein